MTQEEQTVQDDDVEKCDKCFSRAIYKAIGGWTLSEGGCGFEYVCLNCGAKWNVMWH